MLPAVLNALSAGTDVAKIAKYGKAACPSLQNSKQIRSTISSVVMYSKWLTRMQRIYDRGLSLGDRGLSMSSTRLGFDVLNAMGLLEVLP